MQFLDLRACKTWAKTAGFSGRGLHALFSPKSGSGQGAFAVFEDEAMGRCAPLGRLVARLPGLAGTPKLLWLTEYGVWPSSENIDMFERLKWSYGERRPHPEIPGVVFAARETGDLANFLQLAFAFGWGGYVLTQPAGTNVHFSHDGWFRARATPRREAKIAAIIREFGLASH